MKRLSKYFPGFLKFPAAAFFSIAIFVSGLIQNTARAVPEGLRPAPLRFPPCFETFSISHFDSQTILRAADLVKINFRIAQDNPFAVRVPNLFHELGRVPFAAHDPEIYGPDVFSTKTITNYLHPFVPCSGSLWRVESDKFHAGNKLAILHRHAGNFETVTASPDFAVDVDASRHFALPILWHVDFVSASGPEFEPVPISPAAVQLFRNEPAIYAMPVTVPGAQQGHLAFVDHAATMAQGFLISSTEFQWRAV